MKTAAIAPSLLASLFLFGASLGASESATTLIEAEDFQMTANWLVSPDSGSSSGKILKSAGSDTDALSVITLPADGEYKLWVRARDYPHADPGKRRYRLVIDNEPIEKEAGAHGEEGWLWEKVGERELAKGDHVIGLRDTARFFGRCDAVLLTTGDLDPNESTLAQLKTYRRKPKHVTVQGGHNFFADPEIHQTGRKELARIGNGNVRIAFLAAKDGAGKPFVVRETEIFNDGKWIPVPVAQKQEEVLFLLSSRDSGLRASNFFPVWREGIESTFELNGQTYLTRNGRSPFGAGKAQMLIPRSCKAAGKEAVEIAYETDNGLKATGRWEVRAGRSDVALSVTFSAPRDGEYSVGFSPFQSWSDQEAEFNFLSPMYQFQRRPETANMMTNSVTSHAMALVQVKAGKSANPDGEKAFSFAALADPADLPYVWPTPTTARYGFSLLNARDRLQPSIFAPVLGLADSKMKQGETKTVRFLVLAAPGGWREALAYSSEKIFGVTDYRQPWGVSLTDAALNMIDLLQDPEHGGWDDKLKGFYNIEAVSTAAQVAPLAVVSAALLTRDETLYVKRALPTIEFTLSRPVAHFALRPQTELGYVAPENTRIHVPTRFFGTSYWQGLHELLGRKNQWVADLALKDGKPRFNGSYNAMPTWSEKLAQYRLAPDPALFEKIKGEADAFIRSEFHGRITNELGVSPFYNIHFYPYWWDLLDLFELTGDKQYLEAAEEGGFLTIAGQWSHPKAPPGDITIHPGGKWADNLRFWWRDEHEFRLGWPLKPGALAEKQAPAWLVSPVGLGLEQPSTYFGGGNGGMGNILMSSWAPSLLRLYAHTGREIYQTYARNSIIGRFANYPGYYLRGFTDLPLDPAYPKTGPDVTSIYYHHIPPHLAFTLEYLVAEAEQRSGGKISFPWVRQQGYVWFTNRIYGAAPGRIGDDDGMWLWFDREAVKVGPAAVTYLTARSDDRFSLVLLNDSNETVTPEVTLDAEKIGLTDGNSKVAVTLPPRGMKIVSLPTKPFKMGFDFPALQTAPVQQKLGGEWGTLHAFRIRSPFGKDSLYVVLTGRPDDGASVALHLEGAERERQPLIAASFPYEFSVYPWPMDRDMTFRVVCTDARGQTVESEPLTLQGTPTRSKPQPPTP